MGVRTGEYDSKETGEMPGLNVVIEGENGARERGRLPLIWIGEGERCDFASSSSIESRWPSSFSSSSIDESDPVDFVLFNPPVSEIFQLDPGWTVFGEIGAYMRSSIRISFGLLARALSKERIVEVWLAVVRSVWASISESAAVSGKFVSWVKAD
jgi:hypothetical protein